MAYPLIPKGDGRGHGFVLVWHLHSPEPCELADALRRTGKDARRNVLRFRKAARDIAWEAVDTAFEHQATRAGRIVSAPQQFFGSFDGTAVLVRLVRPPMQVSQNRGGRGIFEGKILSPGGRRILPGGLFMESNRRPLLLV
jgi:hypothetical protein